MDKEVIEAVDRLKAAWIDARMGDYSIPWMLAAWLFFGVVAGFLFLVLLFAPLIRFAPRGLPKPAGAGGDTKLVTKGD